jgi:hypothetical protein
MTLLNCFLIVIVIFVSSASIYLAVAQLRRRPRLTIVDVPKLLRAVEADRLLHLLDPRIDEVVRASFSRKEFRNAQIAYLREAREYLVRMSHNASILTNWAQTELLRETELRPDMEGRETYIQLSQKLHVASLAFWVYTKITLFRIRLWLIFRMDPLFPLPLPRMSDLRETFGLRFYASYQQLRETVGALCLVYGPEFHDEIMEII